ncbi:hypothetical protein C8Q78DRAFT_1076261 [Trametes maxima]|nr:hypothetical protein C8Q78DRAFT_1076261 [Trametes maxima]
MAVFVPPHPGASTPINTSTWDTETALHGFVYIQTLPRQCRQRESMITAVALPPLPLDSTTLLAPRYIRITMSSYNPYVSAVQAETPRAIVTQEESNATSAASMYDEPPPSYSELDSTVVGPGHSHLSGHDCGLPSIGSPTTSASPHVVSMQATPPSLPPRPSPKDGTMYPAPYEPPPASTPHPPPRTNRAFSESSQIPTCSVRGTQAHRAPEGPPAFRRETSRVVPYGPFETIRVPGMGPRLGDGFVTTLPFSATQPHPFSTHDVTEDEWQHFLRDVKRAGAHSAQGLASASPLPAMLGRGILTGFFCQAIADSKRESAQQGSASIYEVIQSWNQVLHAVPSGSCRAPSNA